MPSNNGERQRPDTPKSVRFHPAILGVRRPLVPRGVRRDGGGNRIEYAGIGSQGRGGDRWMRTVLRGVDDFHSERQGSAVGEPFCFFFSYPAKEIQTKITFLSCSPYGILKHVWSPE